MNDKDFSGSAFPILGYLNEFNEKEKFGVFNPGMSRRELYAGFAIMGLAEDVDDAILLADELIEKLNRQRPVRGLSK